MIISSRRREVPAREPTVVRGWVLCGLASLVYALAVMHRTSVGARAGDLVERYGLAEWTLSLVPTVTILAYAVLQIPVGLLVDRTGSRFTLVLASALLCAGSVWLAVAGSLGGLLGARIVLGLGDACIFLSILRIAHSALPNRYYGMVAALANALGAAGQLAGIFPLQYVLNTHGWEVVFVALGLAAAVLGGIVRLTFPPHERANAVSGRARTAFTTPRVLVGGVLHALLMPQFLVLTALWGLAMFTNVLVVSERQATTMVMWSVVAFLGCSAIFSTLRLGPRPSAIITVGIGAAALAAWLLFAVLGPALESWYGYVLAALSGLAASGVGLAFAHAHRGAPPGSVALRSSVVNGTSFGATGMLMVLSGLVLSRHPAGSYTVVAWLLAAWMVLCLAVLGLSLRGRPREGPILPAATPGPRIGTSRAGWT